MIPSDIKKEGFGGGVVREGQGRARWSGEVARVEKPGESTLLWPVGEATLILPHQCALPTSEVRWSDLLSVWAEVIARTACFHSQVLKEPFSLMTLKFREIPEPLDLCVPAAPCTPLESPQHNYNCAGASVSPCRGALSLLSTLQPTAPLAQRPAPETCSVFSKY